jgi:prepilin-type N-terminal cleavage/methylation domain-containing protein
MKRRAFLSEVCRETRAGFTLIEVVVASVIMVVLAAVTIPQVLDALDKKRIEDTRDALVDLHYGIVNSNATGFMNVVRTTANNAATGVAPGKLTELSEPIVQSNTLYPTSCTSVAQGTFATNSTGYFSNVASTTWTLGGPFISRVVSATDGLALPIGQLQNTIVRTANPNTQPAWIQLRINNVNPGDADALDQRIDGVAGPSVGTIQYTTSGGVSTVNYLIPVPNRC